MSRAFKIMIMLLVLLNPLCAGAAAEGVSDVLEISNIFVYDQPVEGADQTPEVSLAANARYREKIAALAETIDFTQESETLRFCTKQVLAQDDFTALTWQVTNRTGKTLYVSGSEFDTDFSGVEYELCGGLNQFNYVLHPGETLDARFHGWLWEHVEPGDGTLQLKLRVYELTGGGLNGALDAASIEESGMPLLENVMFRVPMEMKQGTLCSALADGQPLLRSMNGLYAEGDARRYGNAWHGDRIGARICYQGSRRRRPWRRGWLLGVFSACSGRFHMETRLLRHDSGRTRGKC